MVQLVIAIILLTFNEKWWICECVVQTLGRTLTFKEMLQQHAE